VRDQRPKYLGFGLNFLNVNIRQQNSPMVNGRIGEFGEGKRDIFFQNTINDRWSEIGRFWAKVSFAQIKLLMVDDQGSKDFG
jgi:hypothetical protein